ncbi:alcohol dehydrogenase catalytic domain-containing protein, partial [Salmonella enterica]|uniref:alcohol dehydrogenase catalytic domain-containing protein n=1 Tax=Salmonella enterica TaxID=28901 RepID=UPI00217FBD47
MISKYPFSAFQPSRESCCGSDLHYYQEGKVGNFTVKAPMILGHEVIGKIVHSDSDLLRE